MNELQKSFIHWRKIFIQINVSIAVVITVAEIAMSFTLHFQKLILQEKLLDYIYEYLIQPNAVIWGGMVVMGIVFMVVEKNKAYFQSKQGPQYECGSMYDDILNATLLVMLTISCATVAYVHYIFRVTVAGFCIPIFLSIVFYSRRVCVKTVILCEILVAVVAVHRYSRSLTSGISDPYILEDVIIIMLLLLVIGSIAMNVIKHMKAQQDGMVEAREYAEIASQAKSNFLANMSHEIRTPINAVMGMDEMILRKSQDEEVLSYALDIKQASNSLLSIINDILDVSKIESGKMEILPVEYDLSGLIHEVYNSVAVRAQDKGLELLLDVDESLPNTLIGDDIRIRQIITNLLSNGVKYTLEGSVTLKVSGETSGDKLRLQIMVVDTGIGIKEEDLPLLKEKFQRIEEGRNRNIEGTGLGMNIAVSMLELMGGSLEIESQYGVGSSFSFWILQGIADTEPVGDIGQRFSELSHVYEKKKAVDWIAPKAKLLVVDDNPMNLKVFDQLLKPFMMRIDQVESGFMCLEKVEQIKYDMIFLDDMMPGLDGMKTLELMKENLNNQCTNTPVIALTANAVKGAMEAYLRAGFDGYLSKPIVPEKLEALILETLDPDLVEQESKETELSHSEVQAYTDFYKELRLTDPQEPEGYVEEVVRKPFVFPEVWGINWQYGMSVWNNEALLMELVSDFYEEIQEAMDKLGKWEASLEEGENLSSFCIRVHALKGGAASVGAMNLSSMAYILEMASKEKDAGKVHQLWPYLKEMMERQMESLADYVAEQNQ